MKIVRLFLFFLAVLTATDMAAAGDDNGILRRTKQLRLGLLYYMPRKIPFKEALYADSLFHDLYIGKSKTTLSVRYTATIALQAYFLATGDSRVNYEEIDKALAVTSRFEAFHDRLYVNCALGAGDHHAANREWDAALTAYGYIPAVAEKVFKGKADTMLLYTYVTLAGIYMNVKQDYTRTAYMMNMASRQQNTLTGEQSLPALQRLRLLGTTYSIAGQPLQADSCWNIYKSRIKSTSLDTPDERTFILLEQAQCAGQTGDAGREADLYMEVLRTGDRKAESYLDALYGLTSLYYAGAQYGPMLTYFDRSLTWMETEKEYDAIRLFQFAVFCDAPDAGRQKDRLVRLSEKPLTGSGLSKYIARAYIQAKAGHYEKAAVLTRQAMTMADNLLRKDSLDSEQGEMGMLSTLLIAQSKISDAIRYIETDRKLSGRTLGETHPICTDMDLQLVDLYALGGDNVKARQLMNTLFARKELTTLQRSRLLMTKAQAESARGAFLTAIETVETAQPLLTDTTDLWNARYLEVNSLISELDLRHDNKDEPAGNNTENLRRKLLQKAGELTAFSLKAFGPHHQNYILAQISEAAACYLNGDKSRMLILAKQCETNIRKHVSNESLKKTWLESLIPFYIFNKDYRKARTLVALNDNANQLPAEELVSLQFLSEIYLGLGQKVKAQAYYTRQMEGIIRETKRQFATLTDAGRNRYWRMLRQQIYDAGKFLDESGQKNPFSGTIFNAALFSKGLLLNTSLELEHLLINSGDSTAIAQFKELYELRNTLEGNTALGKGEKERLGERADSLENTLLSTSRQFGDFTAGMNIDWKQVQSALKDNELAIEFIDYYTSNRQASYAALLLRKDWDYPVFLPLFDKTEFDKRMQDLAISDENGRFFWQALMPYLQDVRTIYFSPTGLLHKLPIEYLPWEGRMMAERYAIFRLSSTRLLVRKKTARPWQKALVYGGLEYDAIPEHMDEKTAEERGPVRLTYLEGSEKEALSVREFLQRLHVKTQVETGEKGTEASFKQYAGKADVIHLATHGFYYPMKDNTPDRIPTLHLRTLPEEEDRSMYHSGICFAFANHAYLDTSLTDNNDGLLTAREISLLDLHHTDLVVLSACLTGGGEITGEGVFGLQRGFKQAGANSIIMSQWNVSDKTTQTIMSVFYKHIAAGMSKRQALLKAVTEQKQLTPGYRLWGAFVLLDGLE